MRANLPPPVPEMSDAEKLAALKSELAALESKLPALESELALLRLYQGAGGQRRLSRRVAQLMAEVFILRARLRELR